MEARVSPGGQVFMNPAAAQAGRAPDQPQNVGEAFGQIWRKINGWTNDFVLLIPNLIVSLVVALLFVALGCALAAVVRHGLRRAGRVDLARMLANFAFWFTIFIGFMVLITILLPSMRPVDMFTSLGIGSVAIGFAFKDLLQNWLAGFLILIRRPFRRGDQIKVGDIEGTVQAVETRATLVKTYSGRLVIIPNTEIYTRSVTVHTAYELRRSEITLPVGLEVDLAQAIEVLRATTVAVENVLADPPPDVLPWEFANNNVNIRVRWWSKPQRTYGVRTRAAVVFAIKRACERASIALPSDTKISFAETPPVLGRTPAKTKRAKSNIPMEQLTAPIALPTAVDESLDPEAEKPKLGELNTGIETLPR
jgi:small conductance mechanosensitive channel